MPCGPSSAVQPRHHLRHAAVDARAIAHLMQQAPADVEAVRLIPNRRIAPCRADQDQHFLMLAQLLSFELERLGRLAEQALRRTVIARRLLESVACQRRGFAQPGPLVGIAASAFFIWLLMMTLVLLQAIEREEQDQD